MLMSRMVTSAPRPRAIAAALVPATPAPRTTTLAGRDAGHAAQQHALAAGRGHQGGGAHLTDSRPATSDIGASSGSARPSWTVS